MKQDTIFNIRSAVAKSLTTSSQTSDDSADELNENENNKVSFESILDGLCKISNRIEVYKKEEEREVPRLLSSEESLLLKSLGDSIKDKKIDTFPENFWNADKGFRKTLGKRSKKIIGFSTNDRKLKIVMVLSGFEGYKIRRCEGIEHDNIIIVAQAFGVKKEEFETKYSEIRQKWESSSIEKKTGEDDNYSTTSNSVINAIPNTNINVNEVKELASKMAVEVINQTVNKMSILDAFVTTVLAFNKDGRLGYIRTANSEMTIEGAVNNFLKKLDVEYSSTVQKNFAGMFQRNCQIKGVTNEQGYVMCLKNVKEDAIEFIQEYGQGRLENRKNEIKRVI